MLPALLKAPDERLIDTPAYSAANGVEVTFFRLHCDYFVTAKPAGHRLPLPSCSKSCTRQRQRQVGVILPELSTIYHLLYYSTPSTDLVTV